LLVVSDGPTPVATDHRGPAPLLEQRHLFGGTPMPEAASTECASAVEWWLLRAVALGLARVALGCEWASIGPRI
jgi:hypothetical protein